MDDAQDRQGAQGLAQDRTADPELLAQFALGQQHVALFQRPAEQLLAQKIENMLIAVRGFPDGLGHGIPDVLTSGNTTSGHQS